MKLLYYKGSVYQSKNFNSFIKKGNNDCGQ